MFYSISKFPGTTGEYYYNAMFKKLNLPYTYTALGCDNLVDKIEWLRSNAKGFSVSMPFKKSILDYLDVIDPLVATFSSCNTVMVDRGRMLGYNNDFFGAQYIKSFVGKFDKISILGNGSMAVMLGRVLGTNATLYARNLGNWDGRYGPADIIINCTACGTITADSPFSILPPAKMVVDLALGDNQLKQQCTKRDIKYVAGIEFYKHQFLNQFQTYTGVKINTWDFEHIQTLKPSS
jgi:shikimate dehydrogenase